MGLRFGHMLYSRQQLFTGNSKCHFPVTRLACTSVLSWSCHQSPWTFTSQHNKNLKNPRHTYSPSPDSHQSIMPSSDFHPLSRRQLVRRSNTRGGVLWPSDGWNNFIYTKFHQHFCILPPVRPGWLFRIFQPSSSSSQDPLLYVKLHNGKLAFVGASTACPPLCRGGDGRAARGPQWCS